MRLILSFLILIALASVSTAGSITVTTTPEQDQAFAVIAAREASATKSAPITSQQTVQRLVDQYTANAVADIKRKASCAKVSDPEARKHFGCAP